MRSFQIEICQTPLIIQFFFFMSMSQEQDDVVLSLTRDYKQLEKQQISLTKDHEKLTAQFKLMERENKSLKSSLISIKKDKEVRNEINQMESERAKEDLIRNYQNQIKSLSDDYVQLKSQYSLLLKINKQKDLEIQDLANQKEELIAQKQELSDEFESEKEKTKQLKEITKQLKEKVHQKQSMISFHHQRNVLIKKELNQSHEREMEKLKNDFNRETKKSEQMKKQTEQLKERIKILENLYENKQIQMKNKEAKLTKEMQALKNQNKAIKTTLDDKIKCLEQVQRDKNSLQANYEQKKMYFEQQLAQIKSENKSLTQQNQENKETIKKMSKDSVSKTVEQGKIIEELERQNKCLTLQRLKDSKDLTDSKKQAEQERSKLQKTCRQIEKRESEKEMQKNIQHLKQVKRLTQKFEDDISKQSIAFKKSSQEKDSEIKQLSSEKWMLNNIISTKSQIIDEESRKRSQIERKLKECQTELLKIQNQKDELQKLIQKQTQNFQKYEKESKEAIHEKGIEVAGLIKKIDLLSEYEQSYAHENYSLKQQLKESQQCSAKLEENIKVNQRIEEQLTKQLNEQKKERQQIQKESKKTEEELKKQIEEISTKKTKMAEDLKKSEMMKNNSLVKLEEMKKNFQNQQTLLSEKEKEIEYLQQKYKQKQEELEYEKKLVLKERNLRLDNEEKLRAQISHITQSKKTVEQALKQEQVRNIELQERGQELGKEIEQFKNRVKLYEENEEYSLQEDDFQVISLEGMTEEEKRSIRRPRVNKAKKEQQ